MTDVIFREWPSGDIIALFPYDISLHYHCSSYEHVGQHSPADYDLVISKTKPAKNFAALKKELEGLGYRLRVIKRRNYNKFINAYNKEKSRIRYRSGSE